MLSVRYMEVCLTRRYGTEGEGMEVERSDGQGG